MATITNVLVGTYKSTPNLQFSISFNVWEWWLDNDLRPTKDINSYEYIKKKIESSRLIGQNASYPPLLLLKNSSIKIDLQEPTVLASNIASLFKALIDGGLLIIYETRSFPAQLKLAIRRKKTSDSETKKIFYVIETHLLVNGKDSFKEKYKEVSKAVLKGVNPEDPTDRTAQLKSFDQDIKELVAQTVFSDIHITPIIAEESEETQETQEMEDLKKQIADQKKTIQTLETQTESYLRVIENQEQTLDILNKQRASFEEIAKAAVKRIERVKAITEKYSKKLSSIREIVVKPGFSSKDVLAIIDK